MNFQRIFFTFLFLASFKLHGQTLKEFTDKLSGKTLQQTRKDFKLLFKKYPKLTKTEKKGDELLETYSIFKNDINLIYVRKYDVGNLVILPNAEIYIDNQISVRSIKNIEDAISILGKPKSFEIYRNSFYDDETYKIYLYYDNPQYHTTFIFTPTAKYTENKDCIKVGDDFYNTIKKNKLEKIQILTFLAEPAPYSGCIN